MDIDTLTAPVAKATPAFQSHNLSTGVAQVIFGYANLRGRAVFLVNHHNVI